MRITYKGDYALKVIVDLAKRYGEGVVKIQDMAERLDIPQKFLEQILLDLKKGGFVGSKRGVNGGYVLARRPREIILGDVVRFIDGPIEPIACAEKKYKGCKEMDSCVLRDVWKKISKSTSDIVDNISFEQIADRSKERSNNIAYYI